MMHEKVFLIPNRFEIVDGLIVELGIEDYKEILEVQRGLVKGRNESLIPDTLLFLEHSDTYTAGIHRNPHEIINPGIEVINVERGGALTYHGPGQLVVYFILNLNKRKANIKDIIMLVEDSIVAVLGDYGIISEGRLDKHTGVWVREKKICSVGFAINESSTLHGIALNINTDLKKFSAIMPCGFDAEIMTSMKNELGQEIDFKKVREKLKNMLLKKLEINKVREISNFPELCSLSGIQ